MKNRPQIKTILYASDLGGQTRPVFRHAIAMADHHDAKIIMVHVVEPMTESAKSIVHSYLSNDFTEDVQKQAMKATLAKMKKRLKKAYLDELEKNDRMGLVKEIMAVTGKPSEEILRIAEEEKADIIILGKSTRKVRGIRVMGSTARRVSRMAKLPVLVIPNY